MKIITYTREQALEATNEHPGVTDRELFDSLCESHHAFDELCLLVSEHIREFVNDQREYLAGLDDTTPELLAEFDKQVALLV